MGQRVEVLVQSMLGTKGLVALITLVQRGMSYGVEVLVERLLVAKGPVAIIALVYWIMGWEIDVLFNRLHSSHSYTGV